LNLIETRNFKTKGQLVWKALKSQDEDRSDLFIFVFLNHAPQKKQNKRRIPGRDSSFV
jgi:hypothetical protein